jgi:signal transduction histidine kinase
MGFVLVLGEALTRLFGGSIDARQHGVEREQLLAAVLEAADSNRAQVARALHDGPLQEVVAVRLRVETLADRLATEDGATNVAVALRAIGATLERAAESLRSLMLGAMPTARLGDDLEAAIRADCAAFADDFEHGVAFHWSAPDRIPSEVSVVLYQVAHEALNNARRHSNASSLVVEVREDRSAVTLEVSDDGCGISASMASEHGHLGLVTARQRLDAVGGTLSVRPRPGGGTTLTAEIPRMVRQARNARWATSRRR